MITLFFVTLNSFVAGTLLVGGVIAMLNWFIGDTAPIYILRDTLRRAPRAILGSLVKGVLLFLSMWAVAAVAAIYHRSATLWVGVYLGLWLMAYIMQLFDSPVFEDSERYLPLTSIIGTGAMILALIAPERLTLYLGGMWGLVCCVYLIHMAFHAGRLTGGRV